MLSARLIDVKVLPSPGRALVTMMRLALRAAPSPSASARFSIGRLIVRNSSEIRDRMLFGVTMPRSSSRSKSITTLLSAWSGGASAARAAPAPAPGLVPGPGMGPGRDPAPGAGRASRRRDARRFGIARAEALDPLLLGKPRGGALDQRRRGLGGPGV
jgi:hypothetical protein